MRNVHSILALAAFAACAGTTATTTDVAPVQAGAVAESHGLPPIPESVPSALGAVPVVWMDTLRGERGQLLMGGFVPSTRTIYLSRSALPDRLVAWTVVHHEACHVNLWDSGLRNFFAPPGGAQIADAVCDAIATARVAEMIASRTSR